MDAHERALWTLEQERVVKECFADHSLDCPSQVAADRLGVTRSTVYNIAARLKARGERIDYRNRRARKNPKVRVDHVPTLGGYLGLLPRPVMVDREISMTAKVMFAAISATPGMDCRYYESELGLAPGTGIDRIMELVSAGWVSTSRRAAGDGSDTRTYSVDFTETDR